MYFARDASYSVEYAGGGGGAYSMLYGQYCKGNFAMIVSLPKINRCCTIHVLFQEFIICPNLEADSNNSF